MPLCSSGRHRETQPDDRASPKASTAPPCHVPRENPSHIATQSPSSHPTRQRPNLGKQPQKEPRSSSKFSPRAGDRQGFYRTTHARLGSRPIVPSVDESLTRTGRNRNRQHEFSTPCAHAALANPSNQIQYTSCNYTDHTRPSDRNPASRQKPIDF